MSFLTRRRSFVPSQPASTTSAPTPASIPFPPAVENISAPQPSIVSNSSSSKVSSPSIIKRVSSLFSSRKKRPPNITPLVHVRKDSGSSQRRRWRVSSDDYSIAESESIDDIRRPSGLGRAVSFSSNHSLPPSPFITIDEESPFRVDSGGFERVRSLSSPNLSRSMTMKVKFKAPRRSLAANRSCRNQHSFLTKIPSELLVVIFSFLPRHTAAGVATACRDFCAATRIVLYDCLDLRTFSATQIEQLISLLAFRNDLTDLVHTFECHAWPSFFPLGPKNNGILGSSFSPTLTATFTVAFQNMHQLTTLVLPSFDENFLRHHSAFGLKSITFLSTTMSAAEITQLFTWLDGQTNVIHLAFPNLVGQNDTPAIPQPGTDTPNAKIKQFNGDTRTLKTIFISSHITTTPPSPKSPFSFPPSPTTPISPFKSSALLPALTTVEAPPSIITSLMCPGSSLPCRPLDHVALNINTTLYAGLRPSALMTSLQGVTNLKLKFWSGADRRTLGKLLSAAGGLTGGIGRQGLQVLQIELPDSDTDTDQVLYKIINAVLSRYQGLLSLQLRFSSGQTSSLDSSKSTAELDEVMVKLWKKHCPSLQSITLLSGAVWRNGIWIA